MNAYDHDDDHDGLVTAALAERSRDGEPPMALTAGAVLAAARRRTRYRRVLGAAAAVTVLATGAGVTVQLTHRGAGNDRLSAGGAPTSPAPTSPVAMPAPTSPVAMPAPDPRVLSNNGRHGGYDPRRKPTPSEQREIDRYQPAFAQRLPGLAHGLTPVAGDYWGTGTVQPYSYVFEGDNFEHFKVWLRSGDRTGSVSVMIADYDFGVPTDCGDGNYVDQTCAASTTASGDQVVTMTGTGGGAPSVLVYLTKRDGTKMFLTSSANTEDGKQPDDTAAALSHLPLSAADLVTLADDPRFTTHP